MSESQKDHLQKKKKELSAKVSRRVAGSWPARFCFVIQPHDRNNFKHTFCF